MVDREFLYIALRDAFFRDTVDDDDGEDDEGLVGRGKGSRRERS